MRRLRDLLACLDGLTWDLTYPVGPCPGYAPLVPDKSNARNTLHFHCKEIVRKRSLMAANLKRSPSTDRLVRLFKELNGNGARIAKRVGGTRQNVNARLRLLGLRKKSS